MQADRLIWSCLSAAQVTFDGFPHGKDVFSGERYRPPELRQMKYKTPYHPSAAKLKLQKAKQPENEPEKP